MSTGRTLKLFLVDGTATGLLTAEIMNWTGHLLTGPRTRLAEMVQRPESSRPAVYILAGADAEVSLQTEVYIGETTKASRRLMQHNKLETEGGKDFWERACIITSKDANLTSAHIFHLQGRLIELARQAKTSMVQNVKADRSYDLPEADLADMEFFLDQMLTILPVIGMDYFRQPPTAAVDSSTPGDPVAPTNKNPSPPNHSPVFAGDVKSYGITARGQVINGEFVVFKGSLARLHWEGVKTSYTRLFEELIQAGVLIPTQDGTLNIFTRDYAFSSPSAAAAVVAGRAANGRTHWRDASNGMTYAQWQENQVKAFEPEDDAADLNDGAGPI
jgi:predicted GIY-YIG superfamily endonuclease